MSQPYVGEIRMFGGNFAPAGWAFCSGQLLAISENDTLFNLIGTTYGGDGQSTFALPNLQSRVPIHAGTYQSTTFQLAETAGTETVTLNVQQIPQHTHVPLSSTVAGTSAAATNSAFIASEGPLPNTVSVFLPYTNANQVTLATQAINGTGGNQPHENLQPYLVINFIISLFGIYPSPT